MNFKEPITRIIAQGCFFLKRAQRKGGEEKMAWDVNNGATIKYPDGSDTLEVGENFSDAVKRTAQAQGLGKVNVYLNGRPVAQNEAPDTVQSGDTIRLEPLTEGGSK